MSKPVSKQYLLSKAAEYKKQIDAGKLSPKAKKVAQTAYYNYLRRAKAKDKKAAPASAKSKGNGKRAPRQVNPSQGFLPTFLSQLNVARIEELIADKAFKAVADQLGLSTEELQQAVAK